MVLVSSGSIALGRKVLGLSAGDVALEQSQAAAAVGQIQLARAYEEVLGPHGITTAQILVTLEDSADRRRYLNSRATLETLLSLGVVPIVNENDTVSALKILPVKVRKDASVLEFTMRQVFLKNVVARSTD